MGVCVPQEQQYSNSPGYTLYAPAGQWILTQFSIYSIEVEYCKPSRGPSTLPTYTRLITHNFIKCWLTLIVYRCLCVYLYLISNDHQEDDDDDSYRTRDRNGYNILLFIHHLHLILELICIVHRQSHHLLLLTIPTLTLSVSPVELPQNPLLLSIHLSSPLFPLINLIDRQLHSSSYSNSCGLHCNSRESN